MSEFDEFAEALMGQLSVEIGEEKVIVELAKKIKEDRSFTVEFDGIESVSKKLNYLIVGEKPTKKKIETAKELKITSLDQSQFLKMLN